MVAEWFNHEFYESTIYLESTVNFITIRVPPPGLPEMGERRSPSEKNGGTAFPASRINLSTGLFQSA